MLVTNRVIDLVQEGIDVALRVRATLDDSGSLIVKNLGNTHGLLVASPEQLERQGRPAVAGRTAAALPTVAMSAADGRASWRLIGPHGREYELQHRPVYTADDLLTLRYAVLQGTGMASCRTTCAAGKCGWGMLEPVLPGWAPRPGVIHAVFPSRRGLVPAVRRFLDFSRRSTSRVRGSAAPNRAWSMPRRARHPEAVNWGHADECPAVNRGHPDLEPG